MLSPTTLFVIFAVIVVCQTSQDSFRVSEEQLKTTFRGSSLAPLKKSVVSIVDNVIGSMRSKFAIAVNSSIQIPRIRVKYRSAILNCRVILHRSTLKNLQSIARAGDVTIGVDGSDLYTEVPLKFGFLKYTSDFKIEIAGRLGPHGHATADVAQTAVTAKFSISSIDGRFELENLNVTSPGNIRFVFDSANWLTNIVRSRVVNNLRDNIADSIQRILDYFLDYTLAVASMEQYRVIV